MQIMAGYANLFYRPRSVDGKTGKRMISRGEAMRGEASFFLGLLAQSGSDQQGFTEIGSRSQGDTLSAVSQTRLLGGLWLPVLVLGLCALWGVNLKQGAFPPPRTQRHLAIGTAISRSTKWSNQVLQPAY